MTPLRAPARAPKGDRHFNAEGRMENAGGRGLPDKLPDGERVLWQGSPAWKALFLHAFHARGLALYFALILVACLAISVRQGLPPEAVALSTLRLTGLALVPIALMAVYSWAIQRSTIYTITNRRVVISFGLAVPMTINLPFSRIAAAGLKTYANGIGDIPLMLLPTEKIGYLVMWPHARPWRMARTEPMLRCIPDAQGAAAMLARGLAAQAAVPMSVIMPTPPRDAVQSLRAQTAMAA